MISAETKKENNELWGGYDSVGSFAKEPHKRDDILHERPIIFLKQPIELALDDAMKQVLDRILCVYYLYIICILYYLYVTLIYETLFVPVTFFFIQHDFYRDKERG